MDIHIAILTYPHALRSAIYGLEEMFQLTNRLATEAQLATCFHIHHLDANQLPDGFDPKLRPKLDIVILPPSLAANAEEAFYLQNTPVVSQWLQHQHQQGSLLCSACAGAFLLGHAGLLTQRLATTHWALAEKFQILFPDCDLDKDKILIQDGEIMTAGGLISWQDLGLELVSRFTSPHLMRQLGKRLVLDTAPREQKYYQSFQPKRNHGDRLILKIQDYFQANYADKIILQDVATHFSIGQRSFLRRFNKATGLKPLDYLQHLRIQKACDALESSNQTVEVIARQSGYEDLSAFRKIFEKITGLKPKAFRARFGNPA